MLGEETLHLIKETFVNDWVIINEIIDIFVMESVNHLYKCFTYYQNVPSKVIIIKGVIKYRILLVPVSVRLIFGSNGNCRESFVIKDLTFILNVLILWLFACAGWWSRFLSIYDGALFSSSFLKFFLKVGCKWITFSQLVRNHKEVFLGARGRADEGVQTDD